MQLTKSAQQARFGDLNMHINKSWIQFITRGCTSDAAAFVAVLLFCHKYDFWPKWGEPKRIFGHERTRSIIESLSAQVLYPPLRSDPDEMMVVDSVITPLDSNVSNVSDDKWGETKCVFGHELISGVGGISRRPIVDMMVVDPPRTCCCCIMRVEFGVFRHDIGCVGGISRRAMIEMMVAAESMIAEIDSDVSASLRITTARRADRRPELLQLPHSGKAMGS